MTRTIDRRHLLVASLAATVAAPSAVAAVESSAGRLATYRDRFAAAFAEFERFVRPHSEVYWRSHNRAAALAFAQQRASAEA